VAVTTNKQRQTHVHVCRLDYEAATPFELGVVGHDVHWAFSQDGGFLAVPRNQEGHTELSIYRLASEPFELPTRWEAGANPIRAMAFCPTAPLVLATSDGHAGLVWGLTFNPQGETLVPVSGGMLDSYTLVPIWDAGVEQRVRPATGQ